jgi:hypothetical protein
VVQVLLSLMHPYVWQECRIFIILVSSDEVKYMIDDALGTTACMYEINSLYLCVDLCGSEQLWGVDNIVRRRTRKATLKTRISGWTSLLISNLMGFCDLLECEVTGNLEFQCHRLLCFSIILTSHNPHYKNSWHTDLNIAFCFFFQQGWYITLDSYSVVCNNLLTAFLVIIKM